MSFISTASAFESSIKLGYFLLERTINQVKQVRIRKLVVYEKRSRLLAPNANLELSCLISVLKA